MTAAGDGTGTAVRDLDRVPSGSPRGRARGGTVTSSKDAGRRVPRRGRPVPDVVLLLIAAAYAVPLLWVVLASFDGAAGLAVRWPEQPGVGNYVAVLADPNTTVRPLLNSLVLCGGATALTVVAALLGAYPLSRYRTRATRPFLLTIVFATGLPITAIMIPVYAMFVQVQLIDSMPGAILFLATSSLPYALFLAKNFLDGVPRDLEESAWTEGAGTVRTLWTIVLPLIRPGTAVVTMFTFVGMWGNFFVPFMLLLTPDKLPAAVSLYTFSSQYGQVAYGQLAAFSLLYSLPVVLLYLVLGRRLGAGFAATGAIKG